MDEVSFNGPTARPIMDNFNRIRSRDMERIVGLTDATMLASGSTIRCKVKVCLSGLMVGSIKAVMSMIKRKALVSSIGKMAAGTKVAGRMESNTARELTCPHKE